MEIRDYLYLVRKWLWLALLCMCFAGGSAYFVSKQSTKIYQATATLLISQGNESNNPNSEILANERLARTYTERIGSHPVLDETLRRLELPSQTIQESAIDVQFVRDTQLIRVSVEHPEPEIAQLIANTLPDVFSERDRLQQSSRYIDSKSNLENELASIQKEIADIQVFLEVERRERVPNGAEIARLEEQLAQLRSTQATVLQSYEQVRLIEASHQDTVILDVPARLPQTPIRPQTYQTTLVAALLGMLMGYAAGFLVELLDDTIKPTTDFERTFGLDPLAFLGRIEESGERVLVSKLPPRSPITEGYRMLRTNIRFASVDEPLGTLVVTSPGPSEGKSTTVANLALVMAQAGHRVVLIDADLRRPVQHRTFNISNSQGLTNALVDRARDVTTYLQPTSTEGLFLLPSGPLPPNPSELLGSQRMKELLVDLQQSADLIIIDSPPVLVVSDSSLLATSGSGVLLIVRSNSTRLDALQRTLKQLSGVQAKVLGLVVNDVHEKQGGYYYYYDSEYYTSTNDLNSMPSEPSGGSSPHVKGKQKRLSLPSLSTRMLGLLSLLMRR